MRQTLCTLSQAAKLFIFAICLLSFFKVSAQDFDIETIPSGAINIAQLKSKTYKLDVSQCSDTTEIYTCPPTHDTSNTDEKVYTDIAMDHYQNIWYITGPGSLYKRQLSDTATCKYVGDFGNGLQWFTCLVADSAGTLYAAKTNPAMANGTLYKCEFWDGFPVFTELGNTPAGAMPSGDLFFYEHRLFMTCYYSNPDSLYLMEITLPDPSQSCFYMDIKVAGFSGLKYAYGAFSTWVNQTSKAYLIFTDNSTSSLVEMDIPNRSCSNVICTYPFVIGGAAADYNLTSDHTTCTPTGIHETASAIPFFKINNPAKDIIRIQTNIPSSQVNSIYLYDLSGKIIKRFSSNDLPGNLDVAGLPSGLYILQISATSGRRWNEKVVKE